MKPEEMKWFQAALVEQRERIMERAGKRFESSDHPVGEDGVPDFADYAADKARNVVGDLVAESEDNLLEKIELALGRLEENVYHLCAGCGAEIPLARLRAKPTASLCVDCQTQKEADAPG